MLLLCTKDTYLLVLLLCTKDTYLLVLLLCTKETYLLVLLLCTKDTYLLVLLLCTKDTYLLVLLLCTKDTHLLQGLTSLKPPNNANAILTSRLLLDVGVLQIFCYITCREDSASCCQLFIDGAVGQQLGDGHFIRPAANFSLLAQQSETGHGGEHSIHVDAPQVHEEHHL